MIGALPNTNLASAKGALLQAGSGFGGLSSPAERDGAASAESFPASSDQASDFIDLSKDAYDSLTKAQAREPGDAQNQETPADTPETAKPKEVSAQDAKPGSKKDSEDGTGDTPLEKKTDAAGLTEEERHDVDRLKRIDSEVRAHEQAHKSVAGALGGAPVFQYLKGPDGKLYAVGGEVAIDVKPVPGNPEATARKMDQIRRAALAPRSPSSADRSVAAMASQVKAQAEAEIRSERAESEKPDGDETAPVGATAATPTQGGTQDEFPPVAQSLQANDASFAYAQRALTFSPRGSDLNLFA